MQKGPTECEWGCLAWGLPRQGMDSNPIPLCHGGSLPFPSVLGHHPICALASQTWGQRGLSRPPLLVPPPAPLPLSPLPQVSLRVLFPFYYANPSPEHKLLQSLEGQGNISVLHNPQILLCMETDTIIIGISLFNISAEETLSPIEPLLSRNEGEEV